MDYPNTPKVWAYLDQEWIGILSLVPSLSSRPVVKFWSSSCFNLASVQEYWCRYFSVSQSLLFWLNALFDVQVFCEEEETGIVAEERVHWKGSSTYYSKHTKKAGAGCWSLLVASEESSLSVNLLSMQFGGELDFQLVTDATEGCHFSWKSQ